MKKAKATVLTCGDYRIQETVHRWLAENGYFGKSDEIIVFGGTRDLVKPLDDDHFEYLLRQLELSVEMHDPDEILLIDHQDCGGYGIDATIECGQDLQDDKRCHERFSALAKELIEARFPDRAVKCCYVDLPGSVSQINFDEASVEGREIEKDDDDDND
ncbi:hypothetical protein GF357_00325 [Candidatus Dojkabacteria bacterium]|nr:hypothetical protein [Candidatus Dojkabacteria bacterium]